MRSSNPVLNSLSNRGRMRTQYDTNGYARDVFSTERPMTVDDVVTKTGMTLGVIIAVAVVNYGIGLVAPGLAMLLTMVGAIAGLVVVLVAAFKRIYGSAALTLTYAAFEGLFVGGISYLFGNVVVSGANAGVLIGQAVLGTLGVFLGMLFVYKTGAVKVTPRFTRILTACLVGVLVLAAGNLLLALFGVGNPLRDGGTLAIIFSLVCIVLAALSFLQDFDIADRMIREGAPAKNAWGVALGLAVTLVWLYTEILRLLSYFQQR